MKLFDELLIYVSEKYERFEICRGIMYGHRMIVNWNKDRTESKRIIELADNRVSVECGRNTIECESFDEAKKLFEELQY